MAEETSQFESILAVDCGSATTQAVLLDIVDGSYRLVARASTPSTYGPPVSDLAEAVRRAIGRIETITGRKLIDEGKSLIIPSHGGVTGVDIFVATASAAPPLKLVVAGLMDDISVATLKRAMQGTYTRLADSISLTDGRTEEARLETLIGRNPDAVIVAGGTDGGASDAVLALLENVVLAASVNPHNAKMRLVYAGNSSLQKAVAAMVGNHAELQIVDNVRPALDVEQLTPMRNELDRLYEQNKMGQLAGFSELRGWSSVPVLPTAQAFSRVIRYLSVIRQRPVLGVNVGSATTTIAAAFDRDLYLTVRDDLGIGHSLMRLVDSVAPDDVLRWLPFELSAEDMRDFAANKALRPNTIPQEPRELLIEQALAREAIRLALQDARQVWPAARAVAGAGRGIPSFNPIIASGGLISNTPRAGQAALLLLDALQPEGITWLLVDDYGLLPALGAIAMVKPIASVQTLDSAALTSLGTVVTPVGAAREGEMVLKLQMVYETGGTLQVEVAFGALEVLPLPTGQQAELSLHPLRRFDIGDGPGRGKKVKVNGGTVGLIIDARGRPLAVPTDAEKRRARVQQWLWDMGA